VPFQGWFDGGRLREVAMPRPHLGEFPLTAGLFFQWNQQKTRFCTGHLIADV
jgi:hypothetical protein